MMQPPQTLNVIDQNGGFTAITKSPTYVKIVRDNGIEREATMADYQPTLVPQFVRWAKVSRENNTLWRPAQLLKGNNAGELQEFNEKSFYQTNNDVTKAIYKVKGYSNRIAVWFDNQTGERIA